MLRMGRRDAQAMFNHAPGGNMRCQTSKASSRVSWAARDSLQLTLEPGNVHEDQRYGARAARGKSSQVGIPFVLVAHRALVHDVCDRRDGWRESSGSDQRGKAVKTAIVSVVPAETQSS